MTGHVARLSALALLVASSLMASGCNDARAASCFLPGTVLPERATVLAAPDLGQSARDLMTALFDGDGNAAERLVTADPALVRVSAGGKIDPLSVAVAACDRRGVDLLLARGAPADGPNREMPLSLALRATDPWFATRLLDGGASADPVREDFVPIDEAIAIGSTGAIRLLLDHGADVHRADRLGNTPLHAAMDMDRFVIAELLLARGADPWATDSGGATFGHAVARTPVLADAGERAARDRLAAMLPRLGWPDPAPPPPEVRRLALGGAWPPAGARGARPVPAGVLAIMRSNAR